MKLPSGQTNAFTYDGDNKIATINGAASNVGYDVNGNLTKLTVNGKTQQYVYDAANRLITVKDRAGAYTYAGYRYDKETGLYFLNARYYNAGIGRFLTKDTWKGEDTDPQTLNRYAYALGDPINFVDHSGHRPAVSGGPEGLDAYNSVSDEPYRPSGTSNSVSEALGAASTGLAVGAGVVSAGMTGLSKTQTTYAVVGGGRWVDKPLESLGKIRYGGSVAVLSGMANTTLISLNPAYTSWQKQQLIKSNWLFTGLGFVTGVSIGLLVPGVGWAFAATLVGSAALYEAQSIYEDRTIWRKN